MARLNTIETKVTYILETYPATRKDDWQLLKRYYDTIIDTEKMSFAVVCDHHEDLGLPSFESIRRCRQKVQEKRIDLIDQNTSKYRKKMIDEYKDYALGD